MDDALARKIQEGVRYQASLRVKEQIRAATKKTTRLQKRQRGVDSKKFDSKVSEHQLALDLTEDDLGTEETHQILQHKRRYII